MPEQVNEFAAEQARDHPDRYRELWARVKS